MYYDGYDEEALDEILPNLYMSGFVPAKDLDRLESLGITHIVNLSSYENNFHGRFQYLRIPVEDIPTEDLSPYFDKSLKFLEEALEGNGRVLVNCNAGQSRAGTIIILYIMSKKKMTFEEAKKFAQSKRASNEVCPNSGFQKQLIEYFNSKRDI
ncbi:dual specificity protein phosphatase 1-A-like [Crassostrea virginica]|uniref:protein-tyrosine-phosphatase n=1 Tax=Crassostrea virginica TaxID=6565 RepID=A0A8B8DFQ7_CRAVI|nr:dual specificity protein phosphatase 1-A-like [Crassostrea virginica]XP_022326389.1 dual specificity protein phosphatase 1-A-like [Crassostrea virginica]